MAATEALAQGLRADRGFRAWSELAEGAPAQVPGIAFLGAKDHWGSVMTVAVARADELGPEGIARLGESFHALVDAARAHAGHLVVGGGLGKAQSVQLGSFGILLLVFEGGAASEAVKAARAQKRGSLREKTFTVAWCVDAPLRKVHTHKGLPLAGLDPPRRWVEQALGATG